MLVLEFCSSVFLFRILKVIFENFLNIIEMNIQKLVFL